MEKNVQRGFRVLSRASSPNNCGRRCDTDYRFFHLWSATKSAHKKTNERVSFFGRKCLPKPRVMFQLSPLSGVEKVANHHESFVSNCFLNKRLFFNLKNIDSIDLQKLQSWNCITRQNHRDGSRNSITILCKKVTILGHYIGIVSNFHIWNVLAVRMLHDGHCNASRCFPPLTRFARWG